MTNKFTLPITGLRDDFENLLYTLDGITPVDLVKALRGKMKKYKLNKPYSFYEKVIDQVLHNPLVLNTALCMLQLETDNRTGSMISDFLEDELDNDAPDFNTDEALATIIANAYGPIGLTNYGYNDIHKTGLAKKLDSQKYNVFSDDLVSALLGAGAGLILNKLAGVKYE